MQGHLPGLSVHSARQVILVVHRCPSCHRCSWLLISLVLAVQCALAACGSSAPAADTPPPSADALAITVILHHFTPPSQTWQQVVFSSQISAATEIAAVQSALLSIPLSKPNATYACPAALATYDSYDLQFTERSAFAEDATVDATGCEVWHIR